MKKICFRILLVPFTFRIFKTRVSLGSYDHPLPFLFCEALLLNFRPTLYMYMYINICNMLIILAYVKARKSENKRCENIVNFDCLEIFINLLQKPVRQGKRACAWIYIFHFLSQNALFQSHANSTNCFIFLLFYILISFPSISSR